MSANNPKIHVDGLDWEWNQEERLFLANGIPVVAMWIPTTMAGFMVGLHRMAGTERLHLALYGAGEEGIDGEWEHIIMKHPTVEEGLTVIGRMAANAGLGYWELVSLDHEKKEARFRAKQSWEALYQKTLGVCWGTSSLAGRFAGYCRRIFGCNVWAEQTAFSAKGAEWDEFLIRQSERTVTGELDALIKLDRATRADLDAALGRLRQEIDERRQAEERLEQENQERRSAERALREKLEIIRVQEESIRALSTPILQIWEGIIVLPVIGVVDSRRAAQIIDGLLDTISRTQAEACILDLTGVDIMDTNAVDHLLKIVRASALLGARCLISGITPRMAQTVVGLGLSFTEVESFGTLEAALRSALAQRQRRLDTAGRPPGQ